MRQRWGLQPYQEMSPGLEDRLAFTITATGSFSEAAALAQRWGCPVDDSTLHALTQKLGHRAEQQTRERLESVPGERDPQRAASKNQVMGVKWARQDGPLSPDSMVDIFRPGEVLQEG